MDWFLYDKGLRYERVKWLNVEGHMLKVPRTKRRFKEQYSFSQETFL